MEINTHTQKGSYRGSSICTMFLVYRCALKYARVKFIPLFYFILFYFILQFFKYFIYFLERQTEHERGRGREREADTESEAGSRL